MAESPPTARRGPRKKGPLAIVGTIALALVVWFAQRQGWIAPSGDAAGRAGAPTARQTSSPSPARSGADAPRSRPPAGDGPEDASGSDAAPGDNGVHPITRLQEQGATHHFVEGEGVIVKHLPDDLEGSRHQRFLVKLSDGHVIKISHNIDLAPRVPAREGDTLGFGGDFEANDLGGVVHWTHHDPRGRHRDGYLLHEGDTYQ